MTKNIIKAVTNLMNNINSEKSILNTIMETINDFTPILKQIMILINE